ncbi:hypothetical protein AQUCO_03000284v1, partial [Aquilegia coerulea]
VLRDHNRRIRGERECSSKARSAFQKNIDELVRDHLNNCWGSNEEKNGKYFGVMSMSGRDENRRGEGEGESEAMRRQTQILDRWAARQAREMITTIERQKFEADLMSTNSPTVSERASTFLRETSPAPSDSSVEVPNLRASSLVQMWKEFEAEAISPRANQSGSLYSNSSVRYSRLNSIRSTTESTSVGGSPIHSETEDRYDVVASPEDSCVERESEQKVLSYQRLPSLQMQNSSVQRQNSSVQRQSSDASEGVRVADIVKRLTSGSQTTQSSPLSSFNENENDQEQPIVSEPSSPIDHSVSEQGELRDLKFNRKPLRVRGRHATKDLLLQLEQERHRELNKLAEGRVVSLFPHRGRIQAMLRVKFLQREAGDQGQPRPASRASELDQLHGRSTIVLLRERFSSRAQQDGKMPSLSEDNFQIHAQLSNSVQDAGDVPVLIEDKLKTHAQLINVTQYSGNTPVLNEHRLQTHTELLTVTQVSCNAPVLNEDSLLTHARNVTSESRTASVLTEDKLQTRTQLFNVTQDSGDSGSSDHRAFPEVHDDEAASFEHSAQTGTLDHSMPSTSEHKEGSGVDNVDSDGPMDNETTSYGWEGDLTTEEAELNKLQQMATNRWEMLIEEPDSSTLCSLLNNVSCPPRGWECGRQTWYDDTLENDSDNEEIHALQERRTVSNLLASTFRERMERLIFSHLQRHQLILPSAEEEETIRHHYRELIDESDHVGSPSMQLPLPSRLTPRSQYQDHEFSDDSDQAAYTSPEPPQPSSSDYQDSQHRSPFTNHRSLEMELIYDLKGHLEKLQYEMSELRESIKGMGMQVKLQNSVKQEDAAAVCHSSKLKKSFPKL